MKWDWDSILNWYSICSILSVIVSTCGFWPYWKSAWEVKGKNDTRPSISGIGSWVLSDIVILSAMVATAINKQSTEGVAWQMIPYVIGGSVVVALAFRKNYLIARLNGLRSSWTDVFHGWNKTDSACLGIVVLAVIAWAIKHDPAYALYLSAISVVVGSIAIILPLRKNPHNEPFWPWVIFWVGGAFGVLALNKPTFDDALIPVLFFVVQCIIVILSGKQLIPRYAHP